MSGDPIDSEEAARKLARSVAEDICIYRREKVRSAPSDTAARDAIHDDIDEGRGLYAGKVSPRLRGLFDDELGFAIERTRGAEPQGGGGRTLWLVLGLLLVAAIVFVAMRYFR